MKKWFKKMYYDEDYQKVSIEYFKDVLNKKDDDDVCYRGDTSVWTGKQEIGNHKKTTIEDLEKQLELANKKLELAKKIKAADKFLQNRMVQTQAQISLKSFIIVFSANLTC